MLQVFRWKPDRRFQPRRDYRRINSRTRNILLRLIRGQKPSVIALIEGTSKNRVHDLNARLRSGYWGWPTF